MTAQGSPRTRFRRALQSRSVLLAELAAREIGTLPPEDALSLVLLYAAVDDAKFERAASRWLGQLTLERRLTLAEIQLTAGSLQAVRDQPEAAVAALRIIVRGRGDDKPSTIRIAEALGEIGEIARRHA